ncbi:MAG TPA: GspH/FimT family pseudopilin [Casimicrobiaceae bacterium]
MIAATLAHTPVSASRSRGFTLVELLTVLTVVTFLVMLALPQMSVVLQNNRLRAAGTDLMSSVLLARSEAIKRNGQVEILPASASDWTTGWRVRVVATGEQLDKKNKIGSQVLVVGAPDAIVYEHTGRLTTPGTSQVQFQDPDRRPYAKTRCLVIDSSGRPKLSVGSCS